MYTVPCRVVGFFLIIYTEYATQKTGFSLVCTQHLRGHVILIDFTSPNKYSAADRAVDTHKLSTQNWTPGKNGNSTFNVAKDGRRGGGWLSLWLSCLVLGWLKRKLIVDVEKKTRLDEKDAFYTDFDIVESILEE